MNRETAKEYIVNQIETNKFSKEAATVFLPFNGLTLVASFIWHRTISFGILCGFVLLLNLLIMFFFEKKWSIKTAFLSKATQLFFFAVSIDFLLYGLYRFFDFFLWHELIITFCTQIIAFVISFLLLVFKLSKAKSKRYSLIYTSIGGSIGGFTYMIGMILGKFVFAENPNLGIWFLVLVLNLMVWLLSYVIASGYYSAYLIDKYQLKFDT